MGMDSRSSSRAEIRVLDLFSGAGGLSAGFGAESSRFKTLRAIEHDTAAAATYAENHDPETVFAGGIEDWLKVGGDARGRRRDRRTAVPGLLRPRQAGATR